MEEGKEGEREKRSQGRIGDGRERKRKEYYRREGKGRKKSREREERERMWENGGRMEGKWEEGEGKGK